MVKLKLLSQSRLRGSTLVEVLVALVILLTVFAMGMLLFARLMRATTSQTSRQTRLHLQQIKQLYMQGTLTEEQLPQTGHIQFQLIEEELEQYSDRTRVVLQAYDSEQQQLVDSLIFISPKDEQE